MEALMIFVAIVFAVFGSLVLLKIAYMFELPVFVATTAFIAGLFGLMASVLSSILFSVLGWNWFAAEQQANIINREYGTSYTQKEVFFARDVIDIVRHLDRNRYEINGDLLRDTADNKKR